MKILWNDIDNRAPIEPATISIDEIVDIDLEEPMDEEEDDEEELDFED